MAASRNARSGGQNGISHIKRSHREHNPLRVAPASTAPSLGAVASNSKQRYPAPINDCVSKPLTRGMVLQKAGVTAVHRQSPHRPLTPETAKVPVPQSDTAAAAAGSSASASASAGVDVSLMYRTSAQAADEAVCRLHREAGSPSRSSQCSAWRGKDTAFSLSTRPIHLRWMHGGDGAHARRLVVDAVKPASRTVVTTGASSPGVWGSMSSGPYARLDASF